MADFTKGYSATYFAREVDAATWGDTGRAVKCASASVTRDCTGDVPLLETAVIGVEGEPPDGRWLRLYMDVEQVGTERVAIATMMFERSSAHTEKGATVTELQGRSVLQPLADRLMPIGSFVPSGVDAAAYAGRLARGCTPAPVTVHGSFALADDLVFDTGATVLEAVWGLLDAAGWCMWTDGDGTLHIGPKPEDVALEIDRAGAGIVMPGVDDDLSLIDVPNRLTVELDGQTATAVNEDAASAVGYPARGRWVDAPLETSPTLVDGEPLELYARRRLAELSTITRSYTYTREWWPDVTVYSKVRATVPDEGISGELRVTKQEIEFGRGLTVTETAGMEVSL